MVISLAAPRVLGAADRDFLEIEAGLEAEGLAWPDAEWVGLFREYSAFPPDLEEPRLEHGRLRFEARDDDLGRTWTAIKERVAATNRMYGELLAPRDRSEQRVEDRRLGDIDGRIQDAQRLLDALD
jgi:hypothetical protein